MSMDFNVEYGSIEIFQSIPDEFKSLRIAGAYQQLVVTDFLKLLVRVFPGVGYNCYLANYLVDKNGGMGATENKPLLEFCYTMEGRLTGKMDGVDNAELAPGTFNIRYTPHVETKAQFRKGLCCTTFDIHVERTFLELFRLKHPVMGYFLDEADKGQPVQLLKHPPKANWIMRNAINEIINNNFPPEHEQKMRDAYVAIILSNALKASLASPQPQKLVTLLPHQENAMERLKERIDKSPVQLSNEALCAMTNLSEETVVAGFRHMFGMTPHDYQIEKKFKQIEQLLIKTNETIQAIALTTGYGQASNLNKEFKKKYNRTPTEFRDEHK